MQELLTNKTIERLKYDLVRENLVSFENLSLAEEFAKNNGTNLGQALIKNHLIKEEAVLEFIEKKLHIPYVDLTDYSLDTKCLAYVSESNARKYRLIPLFKIENILTVAMADPLDLFVINNIVNELDIKIEPIVCSEESILCAINCYYNTDLNKSLPKTTETSWAENILNDDPDEEQLKKIIENIFKAAANENIHKITMENSNNGLEVFFEKQIKGTVPQIIVPRFTSELKTASNLDNNVMELPQVGKYSFKADNKTYNAVVSTLPTTKGERFAIKLFQPPPLLEKFFKSLDELEKIKDLTSKNQVIVVCGPDSGGKTLFIYSMLSFLSGLKKDIITIESAIKYELENISQCELNEDTGFNLEKVIKHLSLQSPDVVYLENVIENNLAKFINSFADSGKTVITELKSDSIEEAKETLKKYGLEPSLFVHELNKIEFLK